MPRRVAILASAAVLVVSACSGSDDNSGNASATTPDSAVRGTDIPEGAIGAVTTEPAGDDTVESVEGASASEAEFCAAISAIQTAEFELEETFGPEARRLFGDVQAAAPSDVAEDVAAVIDTLDAIAELGISTDENDPDAVDAAFEILLDPDFTEANQHLEDYTSEVCGIDMGDGDESDLDVLELDDLAG